MFSCFPEMSLKGASLNCAVTELVLQHYINQVIHVLIRPALLSLALTSLHTAQTPTLGRLRVPHAPVWFSFSFLFILPRLITPAFITFTSPHHTSIFAYLLHLYQKNYCCLVVLSLEVCCWVKKLQDYYDIHEVVLIQYRKYDIIVCIILQKTWSQGLSSSVRCLDLTSYLRRMERAG